MCEYACVWCSVARTHASDHTRILLFMSIRRTPSVLREFRRCVPKSRSETDRVNEPYDGYNAVTSFYVMA